MIKRVIIILGIILFLVAAVAICYKPVYEFIAPKIFDYFVADNIDKLIKDTEETILSEETEEQDEEKSEEEKEREENTEPEEDEKNSENKKDVYKSKTTIGVLTEYDLAHVTKVISSSDKAQIITILKSCVAASDYPDMAKRVSDGLDGSDMSYIESYLRSHLTPQQKKQILVIIEKYVE